MAPLKASKKSVKKHGESRVDVEPSVDMADQVEETIEMLSSKKRKAKGSVTMEHLQKRKFTGGEKMAIQYNPKGQMYGQANTYMQSFIGNLVKRIPITYTNWVGDGLNAAKIVPESTKAKIWEQVESLFDVGRGGKKAVLTSAADKFWNFKYRLTRDFIVPFKDDPQALAKPPAKYTYITEEQWHEFVRSRLDAKWEQEHTMQSNRRAKNLYDHHLSRKGYAGLEQELLNEMPGETEVDRAVLWMKARTDKKGNIPNPNVAEKAKLIEEISKQVEEGVVVPEGNNDVLTMALGTPEHNGRVRGVGGRVNPSIYFNFPRNKRDTVKEVVKKLGEEYEAKTQELLNRQNILWEARFKAFACSMSGAKATTPSEKASYNEEYAPTTDPNMEPINNVVIELVEEINEAAPHKGKKCGLAIECAGQIVAHGHIIDYDAAKVHGSLSSKAGHLHVVVDNVLDEWARLPNPIPEKGIFLVGDAKDAIILWPKDLVILSSKVPKKQCVNDHQVTQLQKKNASLSNMSGSLTSLKMLGAFASTEMAPEYISFQLEDKVFGYERKGFLLQSDIVRVRNLDEVTASIIVMYIRYLYGVLEQSKMLDMVKFANPDKLGGVGCGSTTIRSRTIATALKGSSPGQLCLLPQNSGSHWTLTVINFDKEIVHFMEPLKHEMAKEEWISVVDNGIKMAKTERKFSTKKVVWKRCEGVPLQPDGKQCGYFVMRYMKEIIADKELNFESKWEKLSNQEYTQEDIDEVREEWGKFVAPFYVK